MNDLPLFFELNTPYSSVWTEYTTYYLPMMGELNATIGKNTILEAMNNIPFI